LKPKEADLPEPARTQTPLVSVQTDRGPRPHDDAPVGGEVRDAIGDGPLVVYVGMGRCDIAAATYDQVAYVWCSPKASDRSGAACPHPRGLRITLGKDGFAVVWEVLSPDGVIAVYVSDSLEAEAAKRLGAPLPGRRFAVEPPATRTADASVAGVLPDGPVPMGPYVYLAGPPEYEVTAVACRCSPSLVEEFVSTAYYVLQPIESAPDHAAVLRRMVEQPPDLEYRLRWPNE
jgi:hypothetical protein